MRKLFYILTLLIVSCNSHQTNSKDSGESLDSLARLDSLKNFNLKTYKIGLKYSQKITSHQYYKMDSLLNPFYAMVDKKECFNCTQNFYKTSDIFNCIINQFQYCNTPIELSPDIYNINYTHSSLLKDSIFIIRCLKDTSYFKTPKDFRTYVYYKGRIVFKNQNYILLIIPKGISVGFQYYLCSFSLTGDLISKEIVCGKWPGAYKTYGFISSDSTFSVNKIDFITDKKKWPIFMYQKTETNYKINSKGQFIKY
jgi:hypothetical protein